MFAGVMELIMRTLVAFTLPGLLGYQGVCFASPCAWIGATIWLLWAYFKAIPKLQSKYQQEQNKAQENDLKLEKSY